MTRRADQVAETVRQVVADALLREIRDPRVGMVTVTRVHVTNDLSQARVTVALPVGEAEPALVMEGLARAAGFLRSRVAKALSTRIVPELAFEQDRGVEHAARIDALLAEVRKDRREP